MGVNLYKFWEGIYLEKKLDDIEAKYEQINGLLCDSEVMNDLERYRQLAKERSSLEGIVLLYRQYKKVSSDLEESRSMLKLEEDRDLREYISSEIDNMIDIQNKLREQLITVLVPKDPDADKNVIMEIRAGAGGEEAALFVGDLFRMYGRYVEKQHWKLDIMSSHPTGLGGFKEIIFSISGSGVYSRMKFESGVHRVQRVPTTESSGRIHTSTATVAVLIEPEEVDEILINAADLRIDTYRSSGAGGQHVNKTDSAVRITHIPTGIVVACQDERSQHQNREKAMRILRAKLLERERISKEMEVAKSRKQQVGTGDRSEKIRTYNFPQSRITDHRIGLTVHNLEFVLEGELDEIIDSLIAYYTKGALVS